MYKSTVIIGAQWGDEGKGKVTDYFAQKAAMVVRFSGGNNAGHTVVINSKVYKHSLIPSGVQNKGVVGVLGAGMVVNPKVFFEEYARLRHAVARPRLLVSGRAHLIFPYHEIMDGAIDLSKRKHAAGTTRKGIGPAYADKAYRRGIRIADLLNRSIFEEKLKFVLKEKNYILKNYYHTDEKFSYAKILHKYSTYARKLRPLVGDAELLINEYLNDGKTVLFEGAGGTFMDVDHGLYPHGTATNTIAGEVCTGGGISPKKISRIVGVVKAYLSRVGVGAVPTEDTGKNGDFLREVGAEYGTVTGRPRRCGWLDLVQVWHAHMVNGFTDLAITKLDVLHGLKKIPVCVGYRYKGKIIRTMPVLAGDLEACVPVYKNLRGWGVPTDVDIRAWEKNGYAALPVAMRQYIRFIENEVGVPATFISFGPDRNETIIRK